MKQIKITVLPGDGIGEDVIYSALPIFEALNIPVELKFGDIGWGCWKSEGNSVPARTWDLINASDATLLGAITSKPEREASRELDPKLQSLMPKYISPVIQLRQQLDLYANVRPCFNVKGGSNNFDFCVIRENTEGLYAGFDFHPVPEPIASLIGQNPRWSGVSSDVISCSLRIQSKVGLTRLFEFAFKLASEKKYSRVTLADKPNVLRSSGEFARDIFESVSEKYPHIEADILNVDAVALWMIRRPHEFGVIVAENMFGDILSDLGAGIMGGLGFAPSANIGVNGCYFEPVHGSAPRVGKNRANPSAMFLTIGLLLEHFGYQNSSNLIRQAIKSVIQEGRYLTYDLGGSASTKAMADAIIDYCTNPKQYRRISFLATGSEIIQGDIHESNSHHFSKIINSKGGSIYQNMQVSDKKQEIINGLQYLLNNSDAIVVTGGLGPTSDDRTRFAITEVLNQELIFSETAWEHVVNRLQRFNLLVTESNRQQALFPKEAKLYPNENGTAYGCYINSGDKHVFMLPGPPKECYPMFEKYVIPTLEENGFFNDKIIYRWLTLGLIEGDIAAKIDELVTPYFFEVSYRWNYPYLEIKLISSQAEKNIGRTQEIEQLLSPYLVSNNGKDAFEILAQKLQSFPQIINVVDEATKSSFAQNLLTNNLKFAKQLPTSNSSELFFCVYSSCPLDDIIEFSGTLTLNCKGYAGNSLKYQHQMDIPKRGAEVIDFAKTYIAWQIYQFIKKYELI